MKPKQLAGIGVGAAGQVDAEKGVLLRHAEPQPGGHRSADRGVAAQDGSACTPALRNDVQVAATGELAFGAGRGVEDFICCFVGTGVGGAVVTGGKLVTGASGSAGEIGHIVVDTGGRLCGCGGRGHLEAYASRTAITFSLMGDLKRGRASVLRELAPDLSSAAMWPESGAVRSGVLEEAIELGDELVIETITEAGRYLGYGLASVINLLNPERIVLGGGVIESVELLFDVAVEYARREVAGGAGAGGRVHPRQIGRPRRRRRRGVDRRRGVARPVRIASTRHVAVID